MPTPPRCHRRIRIGALSFAHLVENMLDGTMTNDELAEATGLHRRTVDEYTAALHRVKAAHISGWDTDPRGYQTIRVFKIGAGKDAKRPKLTGAQRAKRHRDKQRLARLAGLLPVDQSL